MGFLRVVEVFPPLFPLSKSAPINVEEAVERFVEGVRSIREYADIFLMASVKNPELLKLSTIEATLMLQERLRVTAAPVIVARDLNRLRFLSEVFTGVSLGLKSMMIAWGDRYPPSAKATNVRDFASLTEAIRQADRIRRRARSQTNLIAPVDMESLGGPKGVGLAKGRLAAGAELLLAQPPTTDDAATFDRHALLLEKSGLRDRVLLNVFPFQSAADIRKCEKYFGWRLPAAVHRAAVGGESSLLRLERGVVGRLRREGYPGVYVTTRGDPQNAPKLLS